MVDSRRSTWLVHWDVALGLLLKLFGERGFWLLGLLAWYEYEVGIAAGWLQGDLAREIVSGKQSWENERPEWANSDAQAFGHSVTMLALFLNFLSSVKGNFYCDLTLKQKRIWLKCLGTLTFKMWTWKMVKLQSEFCICTHVGTWWYRRLISLPLARSALSAVQSWGGRNYSSHSPWKLGFWMRFRLCQQDELWEALVRNRVTWRQRTSGEIWSGRELQEERGVGCRAPIAGTVPAGAGIVFVPAAWWCLLI